MNHTKYKPFPVLKLPERKWPNNQITKAPIWCSVDLRDGNQALEIPMNLEQKVHFFKFLVAVGFKEIEVGFPAASDTEFLFTRTLIEQNLIPDDVTIQVLTQSRSHIIEKTFEAISGAKNVIVHLYNSTSTLQRKVVFNKSCDEIKELAVAGALLIKELSNSGSSDTNYRFEYSPESFSGTEMDYAVDICNAVIDIWQPDYDKKVIINLPNTIEMSTPNIYADQIEYVCNNIRNRDKIYISLHAHNDRGCAVAATELAMMAGADRVEGTLFGNGERTGNADILNLAMNLFSQGIDPELDFTNINKAIEIYEASTRMKISKRHPYAGDLVYTAFSGSHQDAIKKGMKFQEKDTCIWEVPYLPIDPKDVGRNYDPIIRINSQSGKGGIAYILETYYSLIVPKVMQLDFSQSVTKMSDKEHAELSPNDIFELFKKEYINLDSPIELEHYTEFSEGDEVTLTIKIKIKNELNLITATGNGILSALCNGLEKFLNIKIEIINYSEHSMEYGSRSRAITYMHIVDEENNAYFGAGVSSNISKSSIKAVISAVNKKLSAVSK